MPPRSFGVAKGEVVAVAAHFRRHRRGVAWRQKPFSKLLPLSIVMTFLSGAAVRQPLDDDNTPCAWHRRCGTRAATPWRHKKKSNSTKTAKGRLAERDAVFELVQQCLKDEAACEKMEMHVGAFLIAEEWRTLRSSGGDGGPTRSREDQGGQGRVYR